MNTDSEALHHERELPHILVVLLIMIIAAAALTWILPAGSYARVFDESVGCEVIDPENFQALERSPVGFFQLFVSIEEGLVTTADISFMLFCVFSCLYLIEKTGAVDAVIAHLVRALNSHPKRAGLYITLMMIILAAWGSTGTLSHEEIIPFIPLFIAVSIALGYDAIVGISISVIPVGVGFASATINPFTIGVAQSIAGLPLFSGLSYRILVLAVMTCITVIYVLCYASRVKKHPETSILYDMDYSDFFIDKDKLATPITLERRLILISLFGALVLMTWGLSHWVWYINEVAAVFVILAILVGFLDHLTANEIASSLVEGFGMGTLSAIIVGVGKTVSIILEKGNNIDGIIHVCLRFTEDLSLYLNGVLMLVFQTFLNLLIPSGSAQATVSMPLMTPIADRIGMNRQIAVLIFQFGDGFSNLLWPTSFMLVACIIAKIPPNKYYKWFLPLMGICFFAQCLFVFGAIAIGYH
ncbi:hypothetical protein AALB16_05755 [Lachnospiraceae bacterium 62-35]